MNAIKKVVSKVLGKKTQEQSVFLSRWGFHPCDHATYLKLKRLKKIYWAAVSTYGRWRRWSRKRHENRFYWLPKERTEKRKRGTVPIPEPKCCPVFLPDTWVSDSYLKDNGVLLAFEQARMPTKRPDDVRPLIISVEKINKMLEAAEKWYAEK